MKKRQNKSLKMLKYRDQLFRFLIDPSNDIPSRSTLACEVLGLKYPNHLYKYFSCEDLNEILDEALHVRRKQYAAHLARVDQGLLRRAAEGDPQAARLCYQRFEGWEPSEKKKIDLSGEIRAKVFKEILDEIAAASQGFKDILGDS